MDQKCADKREVNFNKAETIVTIADPAGLHARPAVIFVRLASQFRSNVRVEYNGREADAKSLLSVLSLGASQGATIRIVAEGEDAEEAVRALSALVSSALMDTKD